MEEIIEGTESMGFINYVFNFDNENKAQIFNMFQYTVISILPVMLILKAVKHLIPEEDDSKGSLEILVESVGQILMILTMIWFTNKIIRYIPTYSKIPYKEYDATSFIIPFIIILSTMQTKLGYKLNILFERIMEQWNGGKREYFDDKKENKNNVKISQPISNNTRREGMTHQPSQADALDLNKLPPPGNLPAPIATQQKPVNTDDMYQNQPTPLQNALSPHDNNQNISEGFDNFEPVAANSMGGMFGGSPW